jgi:GGDEF domain-containing protein
MTADRQHGSFELLAEYRRLERRFARLREAWRGFRDDLSAERLAEIWEALAATTGAVQTLADRLGHPASTAMLRRRGESQAPAPAASRELPPARAVIEASRGLDRLLWRVNAEWKALQSRPDRERLLALIGQLASARESATTLRLALKSPAAGGRDSWKPHAGPAPGWVGYRPYEQRVPSAEDETLSHRRQAIDAALLRIGSDWEHLRREPAADRAGILEGELEAATVRVADLEQVAEGWRGGDFVDAFRSAAELSQAVHFVPYRDGFTGAYNRQGFDTLAGAELKRCRRYGRPFGLLLLDVRTVELPRLRSEVSLIRGQLREYDLLGRYVDRTLVAGLPESGPGQTRRVATRILNSLRTAGMAGDISRLAYATLPHDARSLAALFQVAHDRLERTTPRQGDGFSP